MDNQPLPTRITEWLLARGISQEVIDAAKLSWNGKQIVIPVFSPDGWFNKYRRDPASEDGPKYLYDAGAASTIYALSWKPFSVEKKVIICEGELDVLALESKGFFAVASTGGAGTFKEEWAAPFDSSWDVYVIYDNDQAGRAGAIKVCRLIPHAKFVPLPDEVGEHGDVTDYFVKLGKTAQDLTDLMAVSEPLPPLPPEPKRKKVYASNGESLQRAKEYPLIDLLGMPRHGMVKCPIHNEKTASMKVYKDNRWYCYGCGKGGDTIDFIMLRDGLSLPDAIKKILAL